MIMKKKIMSKSLLLLKIVSSSLHIKKGKVENLRLWKINDNCQKRDVTLIFYHDN